MGRFNGIYTQINTIIKEKESEYKLVISTDEIVERLVDVDFLATASREDLEDCVLRLAIAVALNDAGYETSYADNGAAGLELGGFQRKIPFGDARRARRQA